MRITPDVLSRIQDEIEGSMETAFSEVRFCLESEDDEVKEVLKKAVGLLTDAQEELLDSYTRTRIRDFLLEVR